MTAGSKDHTMKVRFFQDDLNVFKEATGKLKGLPSPDVDQPMFSAGILFTGKVASTNYTIYTVPANKIAYLADVSFHQWAAGTNGIQLATSGAIIDLVYLAGVGTFGQNYTMPVVETAGNVFQALYTSVASSGIRITGWLEDA